MPLAAASGAGDAQHRSAAFRSLAVEVSPACCSIGFTAYAFGIFPIEGQFARFAGSLVVEPGSLHAEARIEAASLMLDGGPIEADVKSDSFLDVAHYGAITFRADGTGTGPAAATDADTLHGVLTIRGVTRPVVLTIRRNEAWVTAEARISRSAWGITARPFLAGDTVAIRVVAPLPN